MGFVTSLSFLNNWKIDKYDSILIIVKWLTKMVYYKLIELIINKWKFRKRIIDVIVRHQSLPDSIVTNRNSLFTLKY